MIKNKRILAIIMAMTMSCSTVSIPSETVYAAEDEELKYLYVSNEDGTHVKHCKNSNKVEDITEDCEPGKDNICQCGYVFEKEEDKGLEALGQQSSNNEDKECITFTVVYSLNGGVFNSNESVEESHDVKDVLQFVLPEPKRDGYIFLGWKESGKSSYFTKADIDRDNSRVYSLIAQWQEISSTSTDANSGKNEAKCAKTYINIHTRKKYSLNEERMSGVEILGKTDSLVSLAIVADNFKLPEIINNENFYQLGYSSRSFDNADEIEEFSINDIVLNNSNTYDIWVIYEDDLNDTVVMNNTDEEVKNDGPLYDEPDSECLTVTGLNITELYGYNPISKSFYKVYGPGSDICVIPYEVYLHNGSGARAYAIDRIDNLGVALSNVTRIELPDYYKYSMYTDHRIVIGSNAFKGMSNLSEISMYDSVKEVEAGAFNGTKISTLKFGNGLESIGVGAFKDMMSLTSVSLGDSLTHISPQAFENCANLKEVVYSKGLKSIGNNAFTNCLKLTSVGPTNGHYDNIVEVIDTVEVVGEDIFNGCVDIKKFEWNTAINVPKRLLYNAGKNDNFEVTVNTQVQEIGEGAFENTGLKNIVLPAHLVKIGTKAFANSALTAVSIPESYNDTEGTSAFEGCSSLAEVTFAGNKVPSYMFRECNSLVDVELTNNVTYICKNAFSDCNSLESIVIPTSIKGIEAEAFNNCPKLSLSIPDAVKGGSYTVAYSNIKSVTAKEGVIKEIKSSNTSIKDGEFMRVPVNGLTDMYVDAVEGVCEICGYNKLYYFDSQRTVLREHADEEGRNKSNELDLELSQHSAAEHPLKVENYRVDYVLTPERKTFLDGIRAKLYFVPYWMHYNTADKSWVEGSKDPKLGDLIIGTLSKIEWDFDFEINHVEKPNNVVLKQAEGYSEDDLYFSADEVNDSAKNNKTEFKIIKATDIRNINIKYDNSYKNVPTSVKTFSNINSFDVNGIKANGKLFNGFYTSKAEVDRLNNEAGMVKYGLERDGQYYIDANGRGCAPVNIDRIYLYLTADWLTPKMDVTMKPDTKLYCGELPEYIKPIKGTIKLVGENNKSAIIPSWNNINANFRLVNKSTGKVVIEDLTKVPVMDTYLDEMVEISCVSTTINDCYLNYTVDIDSLAKRYGLKASAYSVEITGDITGNNRQVVEYSFDEMFKLCLKPLEVQDVLINGNIIDNNVDNDNATNDDLTEVHEYYTGAYKMFEASIADTQYIDPDILARMKISYTQYKDAAKSEIPINFRVAEPGNAGNAFISIQFGDQYGAYENFSHGYDFIIDKLDATWNKEFQDLNILKPDKRNTSLPMTPESIIKDVINEMAVATKITYDESGLCNSTVKSNIQSEYNAIVPEFSYCKISDDETYTMSDASNSVLEGIFKDSKDKVFKGDVTEPGTYIVEVHAPSTKHFEIVTRYKIIRIFDGEIRTEVENDFVWDGSLKTFKMEPVIGENSNYNTKCYYSLDEDRVNSSALTDNLKPDEISAVMTKDGSKVPVYYILQKTFKGFNIVSNVTNKTYFAVHREFRDVDFKPIADEHIPYDGNEHTLGITYDEEALPNIDVYYRTDMKCSEFVMDEWMKGASQKLPKATNAGTYHVFTCVKGNGFQPYFGEYVFTIDPIQTKLEVSTDNYEIVEVDGKTVYNVLANEKSKIPVKYEVSTTTTDPALKAEFEKVYKRYVSVLYGLSNVVPTKAGKYNLNVSFDSHGQTNFGAVSHKATLCVLDSNLVVNPDYNTESSTIKSFFNDGSEHVYKVGTNASECVDVHDTVYYSTKELDENNYSTGSTTPFKFSKPGVSRVYWAAVRTFDNSKQKCVKYGYTDVKVSSDLTPADLSVTEKFVYTGRPQAFKVVPAIGEEIISSANIRTYYFNADEASNITPKTILDNEVEYRNNTKYTVKEAGEYKVKVIILSDVFSPVSTVVTATVEKAEPRIAVGNIKDDGTVYAVLSNADKCVRPTIYGVLNESLGTDVTAKYYTDENYTKEADLNKPGLYYGKLHYDGNDNYKSVDLGIKLHVLNDQISYDIISSQKVYDGYPTNINIALYDLKDVSNVKVYLAEEELTPSNYKQVATLNENHNGYVDATNGDRTVYCLLALEFEQEPNLLSFISGKGTVNIQKAEWPESDVNMLSYVTGASGCITRLAVNRMEYGTEEDGEYIPVPNGDSFVVLDAGEYYVRLKADKNHYASKAVKVKVSTRSDGGKGIPKDQDGNPVIPVEERNNWQYRTSVKNADGSDKLDINGNIIWNKEWIDYPELDEIIGDCIVPGALPPGEYIFSTKPVIDNTGKEVVPRGDEIRVTISKYTISVPETVKAVDPNKIDGLVAGLMQYKEHRKSEWLDVPSDDMPLLKKSAYDVRMVETKYTKMSDPVTINVFNMQAPDKKLVTMSPNAFSVKVPDGEHIEYRRASESTWHDAKVMPDGGEGDYKLREANYVIRYAANSEHLASEAANISVNGKSAPYLTVSYNKIMFDGEGDLEYSVDRQEWEDLALSKKYKAGTYFVRYKATDRVSESDETMVTTMDMMPPSADRVRGGERCIDGLDNTMEYAKYDSKVYTKVGNSSSVSGLNKGTYKVRYSETDTYFASEDLLVIVTDSSVKDSNNNSNDDDNKPSTGDKGSSSSSSHVHSWTLVSWDATQGKATYKCYSCGETDIQVIGKEETSNDKPSSVTDKPANNDIISNKPSNEPTQDDNSNSNQHNPYDDIWNNVNNDSNITVGPGNESNVNNDIENNHNAVGEDSSTQALKDRLDAYASLNNQYVSDSSLDKFSNNDLDGDGVPDYLYEDKNGNGNPDLAETAPEDHVLNRDNMTDEELDEWFRSKGDLSYDDLFDAYLAGEITMDELTRLSERYNSGDSEIADDTQVTKPKSGLAKAGVWLSNNWLSLLLMLIGAGAAVGVIIAVVFVIKNNKSNNPNNTNNTNP